MDRIHDLVVLGGGPGGYATAFRAASRGLDVALVEGDLVGGTCLNRGCIPSKAALHVAEVLDQVRRHDGLGIDVGPVAVDGEQLDRFRRSVVDRLRDGLQTLITARTAFVRGWATIADGTSELKVVSVDTDGEPTVKLRARHVVIATGSTPRQLPGVDVDGSLVVTSDQAVHFTAPPSRALIVGAGAIGMEFASMWRSMGSEVVVVEAAPRVLPLEDRDCSAAVERAFRKRGIEVVLGASVERIDRDGQASATVRTDAGTRSIEADRVLIAVGRRPRTENLGLEPLGVLDGSGFVETDALGRAADGIWAVGDVRPTLALAHAAFAEGFVVADAIAGLAPEPVDHLNVPRVTYCHPEVASVGLDEAQARELHGDVVTTTYSMRGNARALIEGVDGFVKVVSGPDPSSPVLGVHVVGPRATDLIGEATLATSWGALPGEVAALSHAHPTLYEAMGEAFLAAAGTPFHGH